MEQHKTFEGLLPESQGQILALTVLYVPYSLVSGHQPDSNRASLGRHGLRKASCLRKALSSDTHRVGLRRVPRGQKMLKGHLPRDMYHQVYKHTKTKAVLRPSLERAVHIEQRPHIAYSARFTRVVKMEQRATPI